MKIIHIQKKKEIKIGSYTIELNKGHIYITKGNKKYEFIKFSMLLKKIMPSDISNLEIKNDNLIITLKN
jgi:hypothetical protein